MKEVSFEMKQAIEEAERFDHLAYEHAYAIWQNMAGFYRLRMHSGYLIEVDYVLKTLSEIVKQKYPTFGSRLKESIDTLSSQAGEQKYLLDKTYEEMSIDFMTPATPVEAEIMELIKGRSLQEISEIERDHALNCLINKPLSRLP